MNPYGVTFRSLTLGECAAIEELTGFGFTDIHHRLTAGDFDSPKFVVALQLVAGARIDPDYTIDTAASTPYTDIITE